MTDATQLSPTRKYSFSEVELLKKSWTERLASSSATFAQFLELADRSLGEIDAFVGRPVATDCRSSPGSGSQQYDSWGFPSSAADNKQFLELISKSEKELLVLIFLELRSAAASSRNAMRVEVLKSASLRGE